jgi:hypothetical protein
MTRSEREPRDVRSADPSLSPETNQRLTAELRDAVGRDQVHVPADRGRPSGEPHGTHSILIASAGANRAALVIAALVLLVVGAVVWVTTGSWWVMAAAVALDIAAVGVLTLTTIGMTTEVEHAGPELSARLEEEGVADPDGMLTELVEEYTERDQPHNSVSDTLRPGHNQRTVTPDDNPQQATNEQATAVTPSNDPSRPAGPTERE